MNVKSEYKIGEISKLFGIGLDSLRYYEKIGILKPTRNSENNYRSYNMNEIKKLNLMRELQQLEFSLSEIKEYFKNRSLDSTVQLLEKELSSISEKVLKLEQLRRNINLRLNNIKSAVSQDCDGKIRFVELPDRYCIIADSDGCTNEELFYITRLLLSSAERDLYTIGNTDCHFLSAAEDNYSGNYLRNKKLFLILNEPTNKANYLLPGGLYLSLTYSGNLSKTKEMVSQMLAFAANNGYHIISDPIEMCRIDTFETDNKNEYITELQMRLEKC